MEIINITEENFEDEVEKSDKPVLVEFFGRWCPSCTVLHPIVEEFAEEHPEIKVGVVDFDNERGLLHRFKIRTAPALFFFRDGELIRAHSSVALKEQIEEMVAL